MLQTINCSYKVYPLCDVYTDIYACEVENKTIFEKTEMKFIGAHQNGKSNEDVKRLNFRNCEISKIPQGLTKVFPNLKILSIFSSKLKFIERDDLKEYLKCICLLFGSNQIEFLPGNLFTGMGNLEYIAFNNNKLEIIEPNLLNGLEKLKYVNFRDNPCINKYYQSESKESNATIDEIKNEIRENFSKLTPELTEKYEKLKRDEKVKQNNTDDLFIWKDLKKAIQNEMLKDFTVAVDGEEFKVHKFLLAARSPVFAEMIENNIDAECLNVTDISLEIFREILNFIYTNQLSTSATFNLIHLFIAATRLKIDQLKVFAAEKIKVTAENAIEILTLANKFGSEILRQNSVEEIKKILCIAEIDDELVNQPEELAELIEIKRMRDELEAKFNKKLNIK